MESIVLGGGCFWCTEAVFGMIKGVVRVTSGYAGGDVKNPTYKQVCTGETGHAEVVRIEYELEKVSLEDLLEVFFEAHDPTTLNRQGNDAGTQYRSIILYTNVKQKEAAEKFIRKIKGKFNNPVVTEIKKLEGFYHAEEKHLKYYERNKNAPYCRLVISPKLEKIKKKFVQE